MTKPSRIIDSHQHVFWHGRDDAGLISDMDARDIEKSWLLMWEIARGEDVPSMHKVLNPLNIRFDGTHSGIPLRDLLAARDRFPERFVLGYCPHPLIGDAPALLQSAVQIYGVQVCGEWKFQTLIDDPRCLELFHTAGELKLPVVLHLDVPYLCVEGTNTYQSTWYGGTVQNLERALQACPQTNFIGHAPGFWREISGDADQQGASLPSGPVTEGGRLFQLFEEYSNLYADLSAGSGLNALKRDPQHARTFLQQFQDRLLFGRDYYGQELHEFLKTLDLSPDVLEKIYYLNAESLVI